jgi:hypothetical protein
VISISSGSSGSQCGGRDSLANLQWQTIRAEKAKDAWERGLSAAAPGADALAILAERQELDPGGFKHLTYRG